MFEDINITPSLKNTLQNALDNSRLSHALILEGSDEATRLKTAKAIAMHLLCKGNKRPCGVCSSCIKVIGSSHPDLHILTKDEKSAMIKVDTVRDIKAKATVLPNDGDKSVFIITEAQLMNVQAQNALLKIFEEPSRHVSFILTCPSKSSLLETITSRATAYTLGEEISTFSDEKYSEAKQTAAELLECFISENELQFIKKTAVFRKDKSYFLLTLKAALPIIRDALVLASGGRVPISDKQETAKKLKSAMTQKKLMELLEVTEKIIENTENAANHNLSITRLSAVFYSIKQKG
ncbi:MAG: hypothetical protein IJW86_00670 [Clostridia bacterium]|nr:hypothetical protein [Clostridia bacterium]